MKPLAIGPQDALPDLEPCFDGLIQFHCHNLAGSPDWRYIKAVIKQESQFNPVAVSPTGPMGLGQFTRSTWNARRPGKDRRDVFEMIGAMVEEYTAAWSWAQSHGAKQVHRFAAGSYNCGIGNLTKAMQIASQRGADPTEWGNMPTALLDVVNAAKVEEVVNYVNNIMRYWTEYGSTVA